MWRVNNVHEVRPYCLSHHNFEWTLQIFGKSFITIFFIIWWSLRQTRLPIKWQKLGLKSKESKCLNKNGEEQLNRKCIIKVTVKTKRGKGKRKKVHIMIKHKYKQWKLYEALSSTLWRGSPITSYRIWDPITIGICVLAWKSDHQPKSERMDFHQIISSMKIRI